MRRGFFRRLHKALWYLSRFVRRQAPYMARTGAPLRLYRRVFVDCLTREGAEWRHHDAQAAFRASAAGGTFSNDWFSPMLPMWLSAIDRIGLRDRSVAEILEIGSWEGMSSLFLLETFPTARLHCVDTWGGGDEQRADEGIVQGALSGVERRFDANTAAHADRVVKHAGTSVAYFAANLRREVFDLIYVDGSHYGSDVVADAVYAFEMLKVGGMIVFDDYFWRYYRDDLDNPASAINAFLRMKAHSCEIVHAYQQVIAVKTRPSPATS